MNPTTYARLVTIDTGERLRAAREGCRISRSDLAVACGQPVDLITALEEGAPGAGSHLRRLASAFTALGLDLTTTVEQADAAVRDKHGDPSGLPRRTASATPVGGFPEVGEGFSTQLTTLAPGALT